MEEGSVRVRGVRARGLAVEVARGDGEQRRVRGGGVGHHRRS